MGLDMSSEVSEAYVSCHASEQAFHIAKSEACQFILAYYSQILHTHGQTVTLVLKDSDSITLGFMNILLQVFHL